MKAGKIVLILVGGFLVIWFVSMFKRSSTSTGYLPTSGNLPYYPTGSTGGNVATGVIGALTQGFALLAKNWGFWNTGSSAPSSGIGTTTGGYNTGFPGE